MSEGGATSRPSGSRHAFRLAGRATADRRGAEGPARRVQRHLAAYFADPEAADEAARRSASRRATRTSTRASWRRTRRRQRDPEPGRDDHAGSEHDHGRRPSPQNSRRAGHSSGRSTGGLAGARHLASLLAPEPARWMASATTRREPTRAPGGPVHVPGVARPTHFAAKAKRVIYLFQSGAPSQLDLFDHKPSLDEAARHGPARLHPHGPAAHRHDLGAGDASPSPAPMFKFAQHGKSGTWVSELLPHTARGRRRPLHHPLDAHRGDQPRPGHHLLPDRLAAGRPAEHRLVAQPTASAARTATCPPSSS